MREAIFLLFLLPTCVCVSSPFSKGPLHLKPLRGGSVGSGGQEIKAWYQVNDPHWAERDGSSSSRHDAYLEGYKPALQHRYARYKDLKRRIIEVEGSLEKFAMGYQTFGVHTSTDPAKPGIVAREWAPHAQALSLIGDFNGWDRDKHPYAKDEYGVWSLFIKGSGVVIPHGSRVMLAITTNTGEVTTRISPYITRAVQPSVDSPTYPAFEGVFWDPA
eukprot:CAMPEP_0173427656 /NCGR_PEP_ID=MMETSP1357-20121228/6805_1 /TAXON_ID=77926 /ORGANISM="Hemiselmis rufescens, Strain PCC563" /LENGTH=216 /DNA_ID=CAMNT_0014391539 /DNA_START=76 /DNA_END=722 /DNA_ORIENTATION=-